MHLGKVVGTVVATVKSPNLRGQRLLLVQPCTWDRQPDGEMFVAVDLVSAGRGEWVTYVKGREAANALEDAFNPSDRAILSIVDSINCTAPTDEAPPGMPPAKRPPSGGKDA
jgi:ethanolamine utilization protein EutN